MEKKSKPRRPKSPPKNSRVPKDPRGNDLTPRGASFDTEEGRAAQGMRPELGGPPDEHDTIPLPPGTEAAEPKRDDHPRGDHPPDDHSKDK